MVLYLDDLLIYSPDFNTHIDRLQAIFNRLREEGIKLNPEKMFVKCSVSFLGHVLSEEGVSTDLAKVTAVKNFPTPTTVRDVRAFLMLAGYYRRFVKAKPNHYLDPYKRQQPLQRIHNSKIVVIRIVLKHLKA
ncbi:Pol polyprotein [Plakobranchus ocellatus]|uniref:Pol polyprotein n=1 Tax=Plakobranchus ocellatus TaxID=259542 RepID=A0AAV4BC08_9GAST|nr:Pol polyprotein [Plakobranchus ocellatus]